jgi:hypothetical protein
VLFLQDQLEIFRHMGATLEAFGSPFHINICSWCAASGLFRSPSALGHHLNLPVDSRF